VEASSVEASAVEAASASSMETPSLSRGHGGPGQAECQGGSSDQFSKHGTTFR
jgi:hypothetical protein